MRELKSGKLYRNIILLIVIAVTHFGLITHAADDDLTRSFIGCWAVNEADSDIFYMIIREGGIASSFFSGQLSNKIEKGNWRIKDDKLIVNWLNGYRDILKWSGDDYVNTTYLPKRNSKRAKSKSGKAYRVNPKRIGSLALDTSKIKKEKVNIDEQVQLPPARNEFIGYWKITDNDNKDFFVLLKRGGRASYELRDEQGIAESQDGNWTIVKNIAESYDGTWTTFKDIARIVWEDGNGDSIQKVNNEFIYLSYVPGGYSNYKLNDVYNLEKVSDRNIQKLFQTTTAQLQRYSQYLGIWQVDDIKKNRYFIQVKKWGRAKNFKKLNEIEDAMDGSWELVENSLVITWGNGNKDVISYEPNGFVKSSFNPSTPITAKPESVKSLKRVEG